MIRKLKLNVCKFCHNPFFGDPRRRYCYKKECEEKRRQEKLQYQRNYMSAHKKRNRSPTDFHSVREEIKVKKIYTKIPCLKCFKMFLSEGIHNRICDKCRGINNNLTECERRYEVWL